MISLDDKKWKNMKGGYNIKYNPLEIIDFFKNDINSVDAWDLIWENLHHQGDIGEASYAIIPVLIDLFISKKSTDWQLYSFVSLIIQESHRKSNPKIPNWLKADFKKSLDDLFKMSISDIKEFKEETWVRSIIGFILMYKGLLKYGSIVSSYDESEIDEFVEERIGWNEYYK